MEGREFVVNNLSPETTQGIAATLIIIRAGLCVQSGPVFSEPPSKMDFTVPMLSTQVCTSVHTEPGHHRLSAEMPVSEINSRSRSVDLGLSSSFMGSVTTAAM